MVSWGNQNVLLSYECKFCCSKFPRSKHCPPCLQPHILVISTPIFEAYVVDAQETMKREMILSKLMTKPEDVNFSPDLPNVRALAKKLGLDANAVQPFMNDLYRESLPAHQTKRHEGSAEQLDRLTKLVSTERNLVCMDKCIWKP